MGSWLTYGLGTENQNLPGFIAMSPRAQPRGKLANWGNAFLPGAYAGTYVNIASMKPDQIVRDLKNKWLPRAAQRQQADLLTKLNQLDLERQSRDQQLEANIQAMEMAFRMHTAQNRSRYHIRSWLAQHAGAGRLLEVGWASHQAGCSGPLCRYRACSPGGPLPRRRAQELGRSHR